MTAFGPEEIFNRAKQDPDNRVRLKIETSNVWVRLVGSALFFAAVFFIGKWLSELGDGWLDNIALLISATITGTIAAMFRRRAKGLIKAFGPFDEIAQAVIGSQEKVRASIDAKPLPYGVAVAFGGAIGLVIVKVLTTAVLVTLTNQWLALAVGLLVGGLIVLPSLLPDLWRKVSALAR